MFFSCEEPSSRIIAGSIRLKKENKRTVYSFLLSGINHTILVCNFLHFLNYIFYKVHGCFLCSEFFYSGIPGIFFAESRFFYHHKQITNKSQANRKQKTKKSQTKKYS